MITVPRALVRELTAVFRTLAPGRPAPAAEWIAGPDGLTVQAVGAGVAVRHQVPGRRPAFRGRAPLPPGTEPVATIRSVGPQTAPAFPEPPPRFTRVRLPLLAALHAAAGVAARDQPGRFVLNHLQLRGGARGSIVASDSHQLLAQTGFAFPWTGDRLVPRSDVFAPLAATSGGDESVAGTATHVWIRSGPWTVALPRATTGRFPETDPFLMKSKSPVTEWAFTEEERDRLLRELPRLAGGGRDGTTVVLDFGRRCLRGEGEPGTTLPLPASEVTGRALRLTCDRRYLLAALKLGFRTVAATAVEQPLVWRDDTRTYLFLPVAEAPQTGRRSSSPKDAAVQPQKIKNGPSEPRPVKRPRTEPVEGTPAPKSPRTRSRPKTIVHGNGGRSGFWSRLRRFFRR